MMTGLAERRWNDDVEAALQAIGLADAAAREERVGRLIQWALDRAGNEMIAALLLAEEARLAQEHAGQASDWQAVEWRAHGALCELAAARFPRTATSCRTPPLRAVRPEVPGGNNPS